MEMLSIEEAPWDENHHRSSFLRILYEIKEDISSIFPNDIVDSPQSPILSQDTISEGIWEISLPLSPLTYPL
jgi:hypothetical protein